MTRSAGRPARLTLARIERAGREMGLDKVTLQGVADLLDVSAAALYRHVDGKLGLETLVGESLLAELRIADDPQHDTEAHLLHLAAALRRFVLEHPGMAGYLQAGFPRGASGAALLAAEVAALGRRGYPPHLAMVLSSSVAGLAISRAAAERLHLARLADEPGLARLVDRGLALVACGPPEVGLPDRGLPEVGMEDYFHMFVTACVRGLLTAIPPDRSPEQIMAGLGVDPARSR